MQTKLKVPVTQAQELIKEIRLCAKSGKGTFSHYVYKPLSEAGWRGGHHDGSIRKLLERINIESDDPSFLHTVAPRCKRLICHSMEENLSALGDASIFFLEKMQLHVSISASPESIEFINIISPSLSHFQTLHSQKSELLFRNAIKGVDPSELKTVMEPVKLENTAEKIKIDGTIKRLYDNILIASSYHNLPKCRKILSSYIIRYSDSEDYARDDIEKLIRALTKREKDFETEIRTMIAIDLYYQITRGILNGDLRAAIQGIRKYGYIFEGDTSAKYFYDIDRLERILYQMITDKGLWDELKEQ